MYEFFTDLFLHAQANFNPETIGGIILAAGLFLLKWVIGKLYRAFKKSPPNFSELALPIIKALEEPETVTKWYKKYEGIRLDVGNDSNVSIYPKDKEIYVDGERVEQLLDKRELKSIFSAASNVKNEIDVREAQEAINKKRNVVRNAFTAECPPLPVVNNTTPATQPTKLNSEEERTRLELAQNRQLVSKLQEEVTNTKKQLAASQQKCSELQVKYTQLCNDYDDLDEEAATAADDLKQTETVLDQWTAKYTELNHKYDALYKNSNELASKLDYAQRQLHELNTKYADVSLSRENAAVMLAQRDKYIAELEEKLEDFTNNGKSAADVTAHKQEIALLNKKIAELEQVNYNQCNTIRDAWRKRDELQQKLREAMAATSSRPVNLIGDVSPGIHPIHKPTYSNERVAFEAAIERSKLEKFALQMADELTKAKEDVVVANWPQQIKIADKVFLSDGGWLPVANAGQPSACGQKDTTEQAGTLDNP